MDITKQRTILIYTILGLIAASIIWVLVSFYLAATITIVTDDTSNTVLINEIKPHKHGVSVSQSGTQASARVESGTYTVTVKSSTTTTSILQMVTVGVGEHKSLTMNLRTNASVPTYPPPVTSMGASYVTASSDRVSFIDRSDANAPLYSVDQTGHVTTLDNRHIYTSVKWADSTFGIGLVSSGSVNYGLEKIDDLHVSDVSLPFTAKQPISYAVSPNRTWYISDDHTVYRANGDGSFAKVYTSDKAVKVLSASNGAVLFSEQPAAAARESGLSVLHLDGTKYQIEGEQYESAWSPDGSKLVVSSDETAAIFDDKLNEIVPLPRGNVISPKWQNNTTLLYIAAGDVWSYDLTSGRAQVIASIDNVIGTPSMIAPDSNSDYLYLTVSRTGFPNPTFMLNRINLGSQQPPDPTTAQGLNLIFPHVDSACTINFVDFTVLKVVYKQTATGRDCAAIAKSSALDSKVINTNEAAILNFQQLQ